MSFPSYLVFLLSSSSTGRWMSGSYKVGDDDDGGIPSLFKPPVISSEIVAAEAQAAFEDPEHD
jgi:hypothetical protein